MQQKGCITELLNIWLSRADVHVCEFMSSCKHVCLLCLSVCVCVDVCKFVIVCVYRRLQ